MQTGFDFPAVIEKDSYDYGSRSSGETHGVVLTKPHIVELILDLVDYQPERDLSKMRLLEPSCGQGRFWFLPCRGCFYQPNVMAEHHLNWTLRFSLLMSIRRMWRPHERA